MADAAEQPIDELSEAWQLLMGLILDQRMRWAEVATELGISQSGLRALLAINPEFPSSQKDLAAAVNCDPSYVTGMVDDLENAGYASRRTAAADRRVKTVVLTPSGVSALETARDGLLAPPQELARLSTKDQQTLAHLLRRVLEQ